MEQRSSSGGGGVKITVKSGIDLVTEVDRECEEVIIGSLKNAYPEHKFVGEESTFLEGADGLTDEPTWVIDPLGEAQRSNLPCMKVCATKSEAGEPCVTAAAAPMLAWLVVADGTTNFVHGYTFVCVSIALAINKVSSCSSAARERDGHEAVCLDSMSISGPGGRGREGRWSCFGV